MIAKEYIAVTVQQWCCGFDPPAWLHTHYHVNIRPGDDIERVREETAREFRTTPEKIRFLTFCDGDIL